MVNSSIVELFDFINKEYYNNHRLIGYLVERFRSDFENVTYVPTFTQLIQKHEAHQEFVSKGRIDREDDSKSTGKRRREDFADEEEEAYFDHVSDEPSTPPISAEGDENEIGADLPPLKAKTNDDDDDEPIVPVKKKRKLQFKSISYHKDVQTDSGQPDASNKSDVAP
eukprot:CAMPEP_0117053872 /NCGR_PEP_ID=MMETSP0472-20121206/37289_1 /TAXON_ID=693140 ORGANISM="Tiarina fusus, Strain LIS" /NCGR_SAMPLE_ID=MMETSP0472 /ASSEMBLY_ACC=CAM_ASM_000603 /LENGTH=167 /DNA_ID=CAMNT_0004769149 /DNA_START=57 /DNA_END=560 /DNA_ORIENTATION=+